VRNTTGSAYRSNYTTLGPKNTGSGAVATLAIPDAAQDPIQETSLVYENTQRLSQMGSDYFSLIQPYYHAPVVPSETGYHMYSYSLDFVCLDPMGSTNYGKLTNTSIVPRASTEAIAKATASAGAWDAQTFDFIVTCVNNNIIRISGGRHGNQKCRQQWTACRDVVSPYKENSVNTTLQLLVC
jgi:hypothetical protein